MPTPGERFEVALKANANDFGVQLNDHALRSLADYYGLLRRWNDRLHLVAPCSPGEFATRHVLESLLLLRHLRSDARVLDVGSGGGLPVIPCLLARTDLKATLIESAAKKTVFLREALRVLGLTARAKVIAARFEDTSAPPAEYVTLRALDRFKEMLPALVEWSPPDSTLLLFGGEDLRGPVKLLWPELEIERVPHSDRRLLLIAKRRR